MSQPQPHCVCIPGAHHPLSSGRAPIMIFCMSMCRNGMALWQRQVEQLRVYRRAALGDQPAVSLVNTAGGGRGNKSKHHRASLAPESCARSWRVSPQRCSRQKGLVDDEALTGQLWHKQEHGPRPHVRALSQVGLLPRTRVPHTACLTRAPAIEVQRW